MLNLTRNYSAAMVQYKYIHRMKHLWKQTGQRGERSFKLEMAGDRHVDQVTSKGAVA